jgi:hypothetical protein
MMSDRRRSLAALVRLRIDRGFVWRGGPVADNAAYARDPFVYEGLVSAEHPLLQLFTAKLPRAKRLRVGDNKGGSGTTDSKLLALDAPYVEGNKQVAGFIRVDTDGAFAWEELEAVCPEARVPLPNVAVGYQDRHGRVLNPHLIWILAASVPMTEGDLCRRFRGLYFAVSRGLISALLPYGADPGGLLNAHRVKNPLSPLWDRRIYAQEPYDLGFLKEHVDCTVGGRELERKHAAMRGEDVAPSADHPDPATACASNRFFAELAGWARREVGKARKAGVSEQEFAALVTLQACELAGRMTGDTARSERPANAVARTVSAWTWNKFRGRKPVRVTKNDEELARRLSAGGRVAGRRVAEARKEKGRAAIVAAAVRLAGDLGRRPTQAEVLAEARKPGITSEKTIRRHWPAVTEALAA